MLCYSPLFNAALPPPAAVCLGKFLEGPPAFNNEVMANYLRANYFTPPASTEYHLSGITALDENLLAVLNFIKEYFKNKVRYEGLFSSIFPLICLLSRKK